MDRDEHLQLCRRVAQALGELVIDAADQMQDRAQDSLVLLGAADRLVSALRDDGLLVGTGRVGSPG
ncbi:MAG TPA: hypothetical protein VFJ12_03340 [Segeticoccus sp.]|jgi:phytoene/squalene synthetase|nr:hypothetical protein [Segeticoccus sp.]